MRSIELKKIDELIDLTLKLKAVIYLRSLLIDELEYCRIDAFSDTVKFADCLLSEASEDLIIRLQELVTDNAFTKEIKI